MAWIQIPIRWYYGLGKEHFLYTSDYFLICKMGMEIASTSKVLFFFAGAHNSNKHDRDFWGAGIFLFLVCELGSRHIQLVKIHQNVPYIHFSLYIFQ